MTREQDSRQVREDAADAHIVRELRAAGRRVNAAHVAHNVTIMTDQELAESVAMTGAELIERARASTREYYARGRQ